MERQLIGIDIRSVVPVAAAVFFVLGAITALVAVVAAGLVPGPVTALALDGPVSLSFARMPPAYVFILYPFLSAAGGAATSALVAWLYNRLAQRVGPVRITLSD